MTYREGAPPAWIADAVACVWTTVASGRETVLPDACVDIVHIEGHGAIVAGPDTAPVSEGVPAAGRVAGLRVRPGHASAVLGVRADELRDRRPALEDVWGPAGAELSLRLDDAGDTATRLALLADAVARRAVPPDRVAVAAVSLLARDPGRRVGDIAGELAVSERQLLRRVRAAVGYGPKTLARILRFQRLLALAEAGAGSLAELALAAGYADQPHMTGEVGRLAGAPPTTVVGVAAARGDRRLTR